MLPKTSKNVLFLKISDRKHIFVSTSAFLLSSVPTDSSKHEVQMMYEFLHGATHISMHTEVQLSKRSSDSQLANILSGKS